MTLATTLMAVAIAFIMSILSGIFIIPALKRMKFGQSIREEGPKTHQKKAGTPTMGGLIFLTSIIVSTLSLSYIYDVITTQTIVLLLILIGFGLIGFLDDFINRCLKKKSRFDITSKITWSNRCFNYCVFPVKDGSF